ncbi:MULTISPECIES: EamA family transporter [Acidobacterium]|nr:MULTISPECIES: EamA family transporter [Acidobacterium]
MATERVPNPGSAQTTHPALPFKTYLMLLVTIVAMPFGNVMLGMGMKHAGTLAIWPLNMLWLTALHIFSTPAIWIGVASLIGWFISYALVLSWADYSFVQPATSLGYGVTALLSWLILREYVSPIEWTGIAIICLGVFVVGRTNPKTAAPPAAATEIVEQA